MVHSIRGVALDKTMKNQRLGMLAPFHLRRPVQAGRNRLRWYREAVPLPGPRYSIGSAPCRVDIIPPMTTGRSPPWGARPKP